LSTATTFLQEFFPLALFLLLSLFEDQVFALCGLTYPLIWQIKSVAMGQVVYHDKGQAIADMDSASEEKSRIQHIDGDKSSPVDAANTAAPARVFQAPEFIRNMTAEERIAIENRLRRKIDIRLMPMIVIMYIMNYLDRVSGKVSCAVGMLTGYHRTTLQLQSLRGLNKTCI
jgi:hypothetical protein